ncbi:MAG TPA: AMP-binding protein, partial [Polyangiales bacterium]
MARDTIPARLLERSAARGEEPAHFVKENGAWHATSWATYARDVHRAAKSLLALGIERGDGIALLGGNRPEWSLVLLSALSVGAHGIGLLTQSTPAELRATLAHSRPRLLLVEDEQLFARVRAELPPSLVRVVFMAGAPAPVHELASSWAAFLELGATVADARVPACVEALVPDELAVVVYTSGSEGAPQAVKLSHRNLTWTCDVLRDVLRVGPRDTSVSFLPLAHIAEQLFTVHGPVTTGSAVYYAESLSRAPANLREVQPTLVFAVPRIWEKLQEGMEQKLAREHGARSALVAWARDVGRRVIEIKNAGCEPALELSVQYELARALVLAKAQRALGLANARICLCGAAPVDDEVLRFFATLGI